MKHLPFLLVVSVSLVAAQEPSAKGQQPTKEGLVAGKRYREQEPHFNPPPPPLPIQRRIQVDSGAEHPPSFFESQAKTEKKIESRQFDFQQHPEPQFQQFNNFQGQPNNFNQISPEQQQQQQQFVQPRQEQFQQFNQPQQQQNFQFGQQEQQVQQQQQNFQDQNNFQSRQQETLPTLPPVFIPPNSPVGPPPQLQSPIRNLFREPEPSFSLAGLFQRFLRLFNINN